MSDTVISVENLSKSYFIGHGGPREKNPMLRDMIVRHARNYARKAIDMARGRQIIQGDSVEEFWALKDVAFEVKRGEVVGIIGRNGAGKSTLLKILSRITEPTSGRIVLNGRVASLLEVGTGFHPELTGRENIFLNGAILGMPRADIKRKFDEIVDFAGVEKFLDTPVKRYSSGMYVRLAFAVAAHLEPEILIIDEVLAVGDAEFQKKCLGKMKDVAGQGRTVLFVSHNLAAVRQLCSKGLMLVNGKVAMIDTASKVADQYLQDMVESRSDRFRVNDTGYTGMCLVNSEEVPITAVFADQEAYVKIEVMISSGMNVHCGFTIFDQRDVPLVLCASEYGGVVLNDGKQTFRIRLQNELLQPGTYRIEGAVWDKDHVYHQDDYLCQFQIIPSASHEMHGRSSSAQFVSREPWLQTSHHLAQVPQ